MKRNASKHESQFWNGSRQSGGMVVDAKEGTVGLAASALPVPAPASGPACAGTETSMRAPLARLCAALAAAFDVSAGAPEPAQCAEFARRVRAALAAAAADADLLTPAEREGAATSYRRHLLATDPLGRYAVAALVWMPGQASPVHAHHTWCGYAVLDGTLTEALYDWNDAAGMAVPARQHPRAAGAVSFARAGYGGIHRLINTTAAPAVSIHLYGVPGEHIATRVNDLVPVAATGDAALTTA